MSFLLPQQGKSVSTLAADTSRHLLVCFLWVMKNADRGLIQRWTVEMPPSQLNKLLELLTICVSCFEYKVCLQLYLLLQNSRFLCLHKYRWLETVESARVFVYFVVHIASNCGVFIRKYSTWLHVA